MACSKSWEPRAPSSPGRQGHGSRRTAPCTSSRWSRSCARESDIGLTLTGEGSGKMHRNRLARFTGVPAVPLALGILAVSVAANNGPGGTVLSDALEHYRSFASRVAVKNVGVLAQRARAL